MSSTSPIILNGKEYTIEELEIKLEMFDKMYDFIENEVKRVNGGDSE